MSSNMLSIVIFCVFVLLFSCNVENMNLFVITCSVLFISILIIALIIVVSMKHHSAKYYTHEDKLGMINCCISCEQTFNLTQYALHVNIFYRWTV